MKKGRKLKNYILYPRFQFIIALASMMTGIVSVVASYLIVKDSFEHFRVIGEKLRLKPESSFFKLIGYQEDLMIKKMLLVVIACSVITLFVSFILTHKAVGPIYRLRKFFEEFDPEKPMPLRFRQGDFFSDLPGKVNNFLKKIL
jgi:hypothetical protein